MAQLDKIRLSGTTYDIIDATAIHSLDGYYTTGETNAAITAATNALAESIAEQGYQTSGDVQNAISGKADADDVYTKQETSDLIDEKIAEASGVTTGEVQTMIDEAVSGKVDTTTYTAYTAATYSTLSNKADKSEIPSVTGYADSVAYNETSKYVEFYHGGTGGTKVYEFDASPFLIDGMVESVVITSITSGGSEVTVLEITWNSAAGGQVTDIPLTDIFDASNYYTKTQVDTALSNKADLSAATVTVQESGTITSASTSQMPSDNFNYTDGVYYTSGYSFHLYSNFQEFRITISDGTNVIICARNNTGDTENYTFTIGSNDYVLQTKGLYKITSVTVLMDDGESFQRIYNYSRNAEVAASTVIENTILPSLSGKADTTAVTQSINEAVSGKADTTAVTQSITEATSGKADTTTVEGINNTLTAHTANTDIHVTTSDKSTWSGKQDALVSGTNIKTINGASILGAGNISTLQVEVSGTTLVFS
jgi:hypothetical protein